MAYNKLQRQQLLNKLEEITIKIETEKSIINKCSFSKKEDDISLVEYASLELHLMEQTKQVIQNNIIANNWHYVEEHTRLHKDLKNIN